MTNTDIKQYAINMRAAEIGHEPDKREWLTTELNKIAGVTCSLTTDKNLHIHIETNYLSLVYFFDDKCLYLDWDDMFIELAGTRAPEQILNIVKNFVG